MENTLTLDSIINSFCVLNEESFSNVPIDLIINSTTLLSGNYTQTHSNTTLAMAYENADLLTTCDLSDLHGLTPIYKLTNMSRMAEISEKMGWKLYTPILQILSDAAITGGDYCKSALKDSSVIVSFACSWGTIIKSVSEAAGSTLYTSNPTDTVDLSETFLGRMYPTMPALTDVDRTLSGSLSIVMPQTLNSLNAIRRQFQENSAVQFFTSRDDEDPNNDLSETDIATPYRRRTIKEFTTHTRDAMMNYFHNGQFETDANAILKSRALEFVKSHMYFVGAYIHGMKDPILQAIYELSRNAKKTWTHMNTMLDHYTSIHEDSRANRYDLTQSYTIQYEKKSNIISGATYRSSLAYRITEGIELNSMGKNSSTGHGVGVQRERVDLWTGFTDQRRTLDLSKIESWYYMVEFSVCWTFRQNCANSTGCNPGFPFLVENDGISCFYPDLKAPSSNWVLVPGVDALSLSDKCSPWRGWRWIQGFMFLVFEYPTGLWPNSGARQRLGNWGIVYDVDPANFPPEILPCVIINGFFGFLYLNILGLGLIVFFVFTGVLKTLGGAFMDNLGGKDYIPTLSVSYAKINSAAVELKKNFSKILNETKTRVSKIKTKLEARYSKNRSHGDQEPTNSYPPSGQGKNLKSV